METDALSPYGSSSVGLVMRPAGPEKGVGVISATCLKDPTDPQWQDTPEYKEWVAWMKKYNSSTSSLLTLTRVPRPWSPYSKQAVTISPATA